jgi:hypothetical protein
MLVTTIAPIGWWRGSRVPERCRGRWGSLLLSTGGSKEASQPMVISSNSRSNVVEGGEQLDTCEDGLEVLIPLVQAPKNVLNKGTVRH